MTTRLVLVGGGGHARVVGEAVRACGDAFELIGFVDREPQPEIARCLGVPYLGDDAVLANYRGACLVLGIGAVGSTSARLAVVDRLSADGWSWATVVHPSAVIAPSAQIGDGAVVLPRALVHTSAVVGPHVVVNSGAIIEHDVVLDAHVMIGPGAVIGGGVRVGAGAFVGLGAVVRDHVEIGAAALVAMGAVVTASVAAGQQVRGVPARDTGLNRGSS